MSLVSVHAATLSSWLGDGASAVLNDNLTDLTVMLPEGSRQEVRASMFAMSW